MVDKILKQLLDMGDPQIVKVWQRHGAGDNLYGVSLVKLKDFSKNFKKNTDLSIDLWKTGNLDARFLATMICEPRKLPKSVIYEWLENISYYFLCDVFVTNVASRSPFAVDFMRKWTFSENEYTKRAGYMLLSKLAGKDKAVSDAEFEAYLDIIRTNIHSEPNRARESMNLALIAIGKRNKPLNRYALITANNIGQVDIDHGETNCKTPFAPEILTDKKVLSKLDTFQEELVDF